MLRVTVIGEGSDDHGELRGIDRQVLPNHCKKGCLGTVVYRVICERMNTSVALCQWAPVDSAGHSRHGPPPSSSQILTDETLLPRLLHKLFFPPSRDPPGDPALDIAVVAVDEEFAVRFQRTIQRLSRTNPDLYRRTISLVLRPEMEVLLVQDKIALEKAVGLPVCHSEEPRKNGDLKEALREWLRQYAPERTLNAELKEQIAGKLELGDNSSLKSVEAYRTLLQRLTQICEP